MVETVALFRSNFLISALEHYRVFGPLTKAGIQILEGIKDNRVDKEVIRQADLVLFQRDFSSHFELYRTAVNFARELKKPVVMDLDDDLLALPPDHPDRISTYYASGLPAILHALLNVDAVTVTSEPLKETVEKLNPNVFVLPNYFDENLWNFRTNLAKLPAEPLTIFYMGTTTHQPDLSFISEPLFRIAKSFGSAINFHFYGIEPPSGLEEWTQITHQQVKTFDYENFAAIMSQIQADLAIAPLCDNLFNRSKSAIKFFEYTAMGIPGVYADLPPYSRVIRDGYNGLLAQTPDQWYEKIRFLIEHPESRQLITQNAQESVKTEWLMKEHASDWVETYKRISDSKRFTHVERDQILDSLEMVVDQQKEIRDKQEIINTLNDKASTRSWKLSVMEAEKASLETEKSNFEIEKTMMEAEKASLETEKAGLERKMVDLKEQLFDLEHKLEDKQNENDALKVALRDSENEVIDYVTSSSWKITRPIRKVFRKLRRS